MQTCVAVKILVEARSHTPPWTKLVRVPCSDVFIGVAADMSAI